MTTYAPETHVRRPHVNAWLVAVVVLAAALVALGTWVIVDRYTGPSHDATTLVDDLSAAWSTGDVDALGSLYTSDAVAIFGNEETVSGLKAITDGVPTVVAEGLTVERVAPVTVEGDFASTFVRYTTNSGQEGTLLAVFQLQDGKIVRHWDFELGLSAPFDNAVAPMP